MTTTPTNGGPTAPAEVAWLFCPADRPERFTKALAVADVLVVDLEDGVSAHRRPSARAALGPALTALTPAELARVVVRVSAVGTADVELDLAALDGIAVPRLMLAKTSGPEDLRWLATRDPRPVVALCETAAGVLAAPATAREPRCAALFWGAEDLVSDLGGTASRDDAGRYRSVVHSARDAVLLAAAAAGVPALDAVHLDLTDDGGLSAEARDAAAVGFSGTVCLHPRQVPVVRAAYAPTPERVDWAHRVLDAAQDAGGGGALAVDGVMVDEVVLKQARRVLALARGVVVPAGQAGASALSGGSLGTAVPHPAR
ncbi:MAG: HpcH/HpaI aldolase/citrate lyase family protein [Janthinobacterium lividum]